jgi:hypothetical protein
MKASFGIDRVVKATCKAPVIKLNLRDPHGEELAIATCAIQKVHMRALVFHVDKF